MSGRSGLRWTCSRRSSRSELRAAIVLNRADRTTLTSITRTTVGAVDVPVLSASLGARVAYGEATASGHGVVSYAPDDRAAIEVRALLREVTELLSEEAHDEEEHPRGRVRPAAVAS